VKDGTEIAKVAEPGAAFGELSILLDQPHTADVRALETSQFHIANATAQPVCFVASVKERAVTDHRSMIGHDLAP
jgi:hypothetical protein